jgi:hypothetical protein
LKRHEEKHEYLREALKNYREVQAVDRVQQIEKLLAESIL